MLAVVFNYGSWSIYAYLDVYIYIYICISVDIGSDVYVLVLRIASV